MTEPTMYCWLIIFDDSSTKEEYALTPERAAEIQRTIYKNNEPIMAIIRLDKK